MGIVRVQRGYKYRLYPNKYQEQMLNKTFGCVRYVYNHGLERKEKSYKEVGRSVSHGKLMKELTAIKKDPDKVWLNEVSAGALQESLRILKNSYEWFFKKQSGKPRFKSKSNKQSIRYDRTRCKVTERGVKLQKIYGDIKVRFHKRLSEACELRNMTVTKDRMGRYFVSIGVIEPIKQLDPIDAKTGIDLGLTHHTVLSTGEKVDNPRFFDKHFKQLRRAQRTLCRRKKGSKNREKARREVARIYAKIADSRRYFLHKLSTRLIRENQAIGAETLRVRNMMKNRRLARLIGDVSWAEFVRMLEYKGKWYGRRVKKLNAYYPSSKTCSVCGHELDDLPLHIREWECPVCSTHHDRDVNAARNIQNNTVGMTEIDLSSSVRQVNACGVNVRPASMVAKHDEAGNIRTASPAL